jgi:hypothetical protein
MFGVDRRVWGKIKKEMVFCICCGREEREGWVSLQELGKDGTDNNSYPYHKPKASKRARVFAFAFLRARVNQWDRILTD